MPKPLGKQFKTVQFQYWTDRVQLHIIYFPHPTPSSVTPYMSQVVLYMYNQDIKTLRQALTMHHMVFWRQCVPDRRLLSTYTSTMCQRADFHCRCGLPQQAHSDFYCFHEDVSFWYLQLAAVLFPGIVLFLV